MAGEKIENGKRANSMPDILTTEDTDLDSKDAGHRILYEAERKVAGQENGENEEDDEEDVRDDAADTSKTDTAHETAPETREKQSLEQKLKNALFLDLDPEQLSYKVSDWRKIKKQLEDLQLQKERDKDIPLEWIRHSWPNVAGIIAETGDDVDMTEMLKQLEQIVSEQLGLAQTKEQQEQEREEQVKQDNLTEEEKIADEVEQAFRKFKEDDLKAGVNTLTQIIIKNSIENIKIARQESKDPEHIKISAQKLVDLAGRWQVEYQEANAEQKADFLDKLNLSAETEDQAKNSKENNILREALRAIDKTSDTDGIVLKKIVERIRSLQTNLNIIGKDIGTYLPDTITLEQFKSLSDNISAEVERSLSKLASEAIQKVYENLKGYKMLGQKWLEKRGWGAPTGGESTSLLKTGIKGLLVGVPASALYISSLVWQPMAGIWWRSAKNKKKLLELAGEDPDAKVKTGLWNRLTSAFKASSGKEINRLKSALLSGDAAKKIDIFGVHVPIEKLTITAKEGGEEEERAVNEVFAEQVEEIVHRNLEELRQNQEKDKIEIKATPQQLLDRYMFTKPERQKVADAINDLSQEAHKACGPLAA